MQYSQVTFLLECSIPRLSRPATRTWHSKNQAGDALRLIHLDEVSSTWHEK
jgi:hypothetical protein